jgi:hypothetical protein
MTQETRPYRLKPGKTHGLGRKHTEGDIVHLKPHQAAAFADKFEPVDGEAAGVSSVPFPEPTSPAPAAEPAEPGRDAEEDALELNIKGWNATELIARIGASEDATEVRAIADAEAARSKPRTTVLRAADDRLEELGA